MRAYEIEGWLTGTKIRQRVWGLNGYVSFDPNEENNWIDEDGNIYDADYESFFTYTDWEAWQEPVVEKRPEKGERVPKMGDIVIAVLKFDSNVTEYPAVVLNAQPNGCIEVQILDASALISKVQILNGYPLNLAAQWRWP